MRNMSFFDTTDVLEYLGSTSETAAIIFARFDGRPDPEQCPDELLNYAYG